MAGIRQFELLENLGAGRSARAVLLKWNGQRYAPSGEKIEIHEFVGTHGDKGDRGYAFFSEESNRWEAVSGLFERVASWLPV
jgi:hypothetical protein